MTHEAIELPRRVTGEAMDRPAPKRRPNYVVVLVGSLLLVVGIAAITELMPRGLRVAEEEIRVATVENGMFLNDVVVRSKAAPLHTVMLAVLESGRVEEVLADDGALVKKGEPLFRLSNPQLRLNLVAREADRAQQISNLSTLRVVIETSRTEHERRTLELKFAMMQAQRQHARNTSLVEKGFIAAYTLEESRDRLAEQERAFQDEQRRFQVELRIKNDAVRQMEQAIERLDAGLQVVNESIEALEVRAPMMGRLTDFHLQVGEIVRPEQLLGRIDDPAHFKWVAEIDEYYLGGVTVGEKGHVSVNAIDYDLEVSRVFPQIKDGRFSVELLFAAEPPAAMRPGQSADAKITLGETQPGLLLPNDAFLNDGAGAWVFVLSQDGWTAERRAIRSGRHNNSQVEVTSGLKPGERVIVSAYAGYGKAQRLQIVR